MRPKRATIVDIANNVYAYFMTTNFDCRHYDYCCNFWGGSLIPDHVALQLLRNKTHCKCLGKDCIVGVGKKMGSSQKSTLDLSKPATRGAKNWNFASVVVSMWASQILFQTTLLGLHKSHQNSRN